MEFSGDPKVLKEVNLRHNFTSMVTGRRKRKAEAARNRLLAVAHLFKQQVQAAMKGRESKVVGS